MMTDALENKKDADSFSDKRVVYVPPSIDWSTMYAHAVKLFNLGYSVWVHEHGMMDACGGVTPYGVALRCGHLTTSTDGPKLVSDSEQDANN